jgi:hypothetical protein
MSTKHMKLIEAMVAEIQKHVKSVKVMIDTFNNEFKLIEEVMTKSVAQKINEVRAEEQNKA